jgi:hypothetical protein
MLSGDNFTLSAAHFQVPCLRNLLYWIVLPNAPPHVQTTPITRPHPEHLPQKRGCAGGILCVSMSLMAAPFPVAFIAARALFVFSFFLRLVSGVKPPAVAIREDFC